ncbi:hypothetical protein PW5551_09045 [Petrotoga sp. 9PW.55.5.1]|uniref:glutamate 5-kinase n=1 Tax=Petrotoga sp. 9PW.55.5.1 TaxID=1308979 RepID=UPI000DC25037|nr:glutamate 5-kinase [Petrotoga sp. 9PW.55.5.1]RAO98617.1 hypothetical protein PW5551_09045 [Petrotoga sp. 9PW.55.5.1]
MSKKISKVVIKVGSSSISDEYGINEDKIKKIVDQISELNKRAKEVVIVSSGAVAAGMGELNFPKKPHSLIEKQACSAVGQGILISIYRKLFNQKGIKIAQILLNSEDFAHRDRYLNAYNTMYKLLEYGLVPIVNENDTVTTDEIKFGDNDILSAQVASLLEADLLIILSDIPGLLKNINDLNSTIKLVESITPEIEALANGKSASNVGTGGMSSKLKAAKISLSAGIPLVIVPSYEKDVILRTLESMENKEYTIGTTFLAKTKKLSKRKRWIYFSLKPKGELVVDEGAQDALLKGKSLLAVGIKEVSGEFSVGDLVNIVSQDITIIGKGLVNYSSEELKKFMGKKSTDILAKKNSQGPEEVIHRDNMVIVK